MTIGDIVKGINHYLADEQYPYTQFEQFLDAVVDDINDSLNSKYPVFSELSSQSGFTMDTEYAFFPDKYIREVVIKGAAFKFFITDEEGMQTAQAYDYDYQDALFTMTRDFIEQVPDEYRSDSTGGIDIAIGDTSGVSEIFWVL